MYVICVATSLSYSGDEHYKCNKCERKFCASAHEKTCDIRIKCEQRNPNTFVDFPVKWHTKNIYMVCINQGGLHGVRNISNGNLNILAISHHIVRNALSTKQICILKGKLSQN